MYYCADTWQPVRANPFTNSLQFWKVKGWSAVLFLIALVYFLSTGILHSCGHVVSGLHIWRASHPETTFPWKI